MRMVISMLLPLVSAAAMAQDRMHSETFHLKYINLPDLGLSGKKSLPQTKRYKDNIQITIRDIGMGLSKNLQDKIFQPFFTTKPAGQGTGLGLSLSYDIIKAHGGELKVESTEGEGATFIIELPCPNNTG